MPKLLRPGGLLIAGSLLWITSVAAPTGLRAQSPVLDVEVSYIGEMSANVSGGLQTGTVAAGNLDLTGRIDGSALLGVDGLSLFVYGLATHGGEVTELTGDAQTASNIEAPDGLRLYEAWVQQNLDTSRLSLLAGVYDVNTEFDVIEEASLFVNSSFGIGAEFGNSGVNGPSIFPVTGVGARIQWHPDHRWYAQAAVTDGVPGGTRQPDVPRLHLSRTEGALWVAEVGYLHHGRASDSDRPVELGRDHVHEGIPWRVAVGAWQYTRRAEFIGESSSGRAHPGVYMMAEIHPAFWSSTDGTGIGLFARVGMADDRTNRFGSYGGGGVTWTGLIPGRDRDRLGLGVAVAFDGDAFEEARRMEGLPTAGRETAWELTYQAAVNEWLTIQPDLQYIRQPGADPTIDDSLLLTLRGTVGI